MLSGPTKILGCEICSPRQNCARDFLPSIGQHFLSNNREQRSLPVPGVRPLGQTVMTRELGHSAIRKAMGYFDYTRLMNLGFLNWMFICETFLIGVHFSRVQLNELVLDIYRNASVRLLKLVILFQRLPCGLNSNIIMILLTRVFSITCRNRPWYATFVNNISNV